VFFRRISFARLSGSQVHSDFRSLHTRPIAKKIPEGDCLDYLISLSGITVDFSDSLGT
jgi:hypothetical protein